MGWIAYAIAWLAAALFWALAASWGSNRPPRETLLYGFLAMGPAALMGVCVWAISRRVEWSWRSRRLSSWIARSRRSVTSPPAGTGRATTAIGRNAWTLDWDTWPPGGLTGRTR